ncbi:MAG: biopolymer transporter ExbD [Pseudomonadota bacterium]
MLRARRRAKRLSMTSLIDVIFLLLLFFMLSSTFSRFAEVELASGGTGAPTSAPPERVLFLRLTDSGVALNGQPVVAADLAARLADQTDATLLIAVAGATAQALTDVIVAVSSVPDLSFSVLEGP